MPVVNEFPHGAPCWFELGTTDQNGAKQFYQELFGWSSNDFPIGENQVYSMFQWKDADVAAAYTLMPQQVSQGVPPHWMVYFLTKSTDDSAAKVSELGGKVIAPPFDVMEVGRMAVCADPGGAAFCLWQPKVHRGAGIYGENNTVCWSELATRDAGAAREFYSSLFGWETKTNVNMPTYIEFGVDGAFRGGLLQMDAHWEGIPPHWAIYVMVEDCDATAAKAREFGGQIKHGPFDAPGVGRIALLSDPQGANFYVITLKM